MMKYYNDELDWVFLKLDSGNDMNNTYYNNEKDALTSINERRELSSEEETELQD